MPKGYTTKQVANIRGLVEGTFEVISVYAKGKDISIVQGIQDDLAVIRARLTNGPEKPTQGLLILQQGLLEKALNAINEGKTSEMAFQEVSDFMVAVLESDLISEPPV